MEVQFASEGVSLRLIGARWENNMQTEIPKTHRSEARIYHAAPFIGTILLIGVFLGAFEITNSYLLSSVSAAVPTIGLLWLWSRAGRKLDKLKCPSCGSLLSVGLPWTYPPKKCRNCGAPVNLNDDPQRKESFR